MEPTMELNDETLSALLDGELDAAQRQQVETALASDPGARLRLARMRTADEQLKAAFPLQGSGEQDPLAAMILGYRPDVASLRPAPRRAWYRRSGTLTALAAGISALAIGAVLMLNHGLGRGVDAALVAALDQLPSGGEQIHGDTRTQLVLSFKADDGRWCRLFEQQSGKRSSEGLACHGDVGWQLLALEAGTADAGSLRPAGASQLVDALMNQLGRAPALDAAQEQALIQSRWAQPAQR